MVSEVPIPSGGVVGGVPGVVVGGAVPAFANEKHVCNYAPDLRM